MWLAIAFALACIAPAYAEWAAPDIFNGQGAVWSM